MACASDRCGCVHDPDGHDASQHDTGRDAGCCGGEAVHNENPKLADKT